MNKEQTSLPCPHGRTSWASCPHCLGIGSLNWRDPPESEPSAFAPTGLGSGPLGRFPTVPPAHTPARTEGEWFGFPEMNDRVLVYVVSVDWGTMDGYATHSKPWRVFAKEIDAEREAIACKTRKPFPAFSSEVFEMVVND